MRLLLIGFSTQSSGFFDNAEVIAQADENSADPRLISDEVSKRNGSDHDVVVINAEGKYGDVSARQQFRGVEIVYWLRLKYRYLKPIVLTGFHSSEQILRKDPQMLIIYAPGNFYLRLPFSLQQLDALRLDELTELQISTEYPDFIRPAFNLEEIRHEDANWWGIKALWDAHFLLKGGDVTYPEVVHSKLGRLNNLFSQFLYGKKVSRNDLLLTTNNGFVTSRTGEIEVELNSLNTSSESPELIEIKKKQIVEEYFTIRERIRQLRSKSLDTTGIELSDIKKYPPIVLIDDQYEDGWAEVYRQIFYNGDDESLKAIPFAFAKATSIEDRISALIERASNEINKLVARSNQIKDEGDTQIPVVLLDIRLFPSHDKSVMDVTELSGVRVLKRLREQFRAIPIIVTSASNKLWTLDKVLDFGADAYWMKEGVDNFWNGEESVQNYIQLRYQVLATQSEEFFAAYQLEQTIKAINQMDTPWWEFGFWRTGDPRNANTRLILDFLDSLLVQLRRHNRSFVMSQLQREIGKEAILSRGNIGNGLRTVYEILVGRYAIGDEDKDDSTAAVKIRYELGAVIRKLGGRSSHAKVLDADLSPIELLQMVCAIKALLLESPNFQCKVDPAIRLGKVEKITDTRISLGFEDNSSGCIQNSGDYFKKMIHRDPQIGDRVVVVPCFDLDIDGTQYYEIQKQFKDWVNFVHKNDRSKSRRSLPLSILDYGEAVYKEDLDSNYVVMESTFGDVLVSRTSYKEFLKSNSNESTLIVCRTEQSPVSIGDEQELPVFSLCTKPHYYEGQGK